MNRWHLIWQAMAVSAIVAALAGCESKSVPEGTVVTVYYSSDVRGKLEGCGCKDSGGGITRRSAALAQARAEDPSVVYCDAGNFMTGTAHADSSKGQVSVAAYNHLKASVVNVSERELAYGVDNFEAAKRDARFSFISANLRHKGDALAEPYVIQKVKEARVAFIGLCGTKDVMRVDSLKLPEGITMADPVSTAREAVVGLKGKADLIVVLSTCGDRMDSMIAGQVPGIDLLIGGRSYRPNPTQPWLVDSTRVVRTPRDGRVMGRMDMVFGPEGEIKTYRASQVSMETGAPADPEMLAVVRQFVPNFEDNPADRRTATRATAVP